MLFVHRNHVTFLAPVINISYDDIFSVITFYFLHRIFYVLKYIFNSILGTYGVKIEGIAQLYKYLLWYLFIVIIVTLLVQVINF